MSTVGRTLNKRVWCLALGLLCGCALAQPSWRLNRVPPPITQVLIPPPPYLFDSSVTRELAPLLRIQDEPGTPGMTLYQWGPNDYFPPVVSAPGVYGRSALPTLFGQERGCSEDGSRCCR